MSEQIPQIVVTKMPNESDLPDRSGWANSADAFGRGVADIFSLGLADEFAASSDALFNPIFGTGLPGITYGERYDRNLQRQRAIDRADYEQQFVPRLAGQLLGGVALPGAAAETMGGRAIVGGLTGAGYGFGSGEGMQDRAISATTGAAFGAGAAAAAPYVIPYAKRGLDWFGKTPVGKPALDAADDAIGFLYKYRNPDAQAVRITEKTLRDARDAGQLMSKADVEAAIANGQPFTLMDIAKGYGQGLGEWANRASPKAGAILEDFTKQRFREQGDRTVNFLRNLTGAKEPYDVTLERLRNAANNNKSEAIRRFGNYDAYQAGQKLASEPIDGAEKIFSKLNAAEQELFRHGYASELIKRASIASDSKNILDEAFLHNSPGARKLTPAVLGKEKTQQLAALLRVENVMKLQITANAMFSREGAELASAAARGAAGGGMLAPILAHAIRIGDAGIDEKVALRVARMLTSTDPRVMEPALAGASRNQTMMKAILNAEAKLSGLIGVAASGTAGLPTSRMIQQQTGVGGRNERHGRSNTTADDGVLVSP